MKKIFTNLAFVLMVLFLFNCSSINSPFKKLEGKWTASGDQGEGHSWYMEYTFKGNTYNMTGYPPISESGRITLKVANGDSMLVGFIVKKSEPHYENHDSWIVMKENQILLNGMTFNKSSSLE